jgi:hypothetical protein
VEFGGPPSNRDRRLEQMRALAYNDLSADRNTVAVVQALEVILDHSAKGKPNGIVESGQSGDGLVFRLPGQEASQVLYQGSVGMRD